MTDDLVIDESNFESYFFDVRKNKPKRGQIMACYRAVAYFESGPEKRQIIGLLQDTDKALAASQVMRKLLCAAERDSVSVLREMAQDLLSGMTAKEVEEKPYKYVLEMFFYCNPEHVPVDPHWSAIKLLNVDTFVDSVEKKGDVKVTSKIIEKPDSFETTNDSSS